MGSFFDYEDKHQVNDPESDMFKTYEQAMGRGVSEESFSAYGNLKPHPVEEIPVEEMAKEANGLVLVRVTALAALLASADADLTHMFFRIGGGANISNEEIKKAADVKMDLKAKLGGILGRSV